jgi:hypothetical protein
LAKKPLCGEQLALNDGKPFRAFGHPPVAVLGIDQELGGGLHLGDGPKSVMVRSEIWNA